MLFIRKKKQLLFHQFHRHFSQQHKNLNIQFWNRTKKKTVTFKNLLLLNAKSFHRRKIKNQENLIIFFFFLNNFKRSLYRFSVRLWLIADVEANAVDVFCCKFSINPGGSPENQSISECSGNDEHLY